ncbi:hypothetical protein ACO1GA_002135, partial [Neisseria gonorrhoeae]
RLKIPVFTGWQTLSVLCPAVKHDTHPSGCTAFFNFTNPVGIYVPWGGIFPNLGGFYAYSI